MIRLIEHPADNVSRVGPRIDTASDEAVDARLALFERLREAQVQAQLEASVAAADGGGEVVSIGGGRKAAA